nr:LCP family protein [Paenibacillus sp. SYP-B3998]
MAGYLYWTIDPSRHFEHVQVPTLATPKEVTPTISSAPASRAENLFEAKPDEHEKKVSTAFNVLVLGIDARGEENSRSDVIMVVHVIPSARKANIVSLPRDTKVSINGVGYTKINHAHLLGEQKGGNRGGTAEVLQVVSDFLEVPINYYVKTDFAGFEDFINTIGGVDVDVTQDIRLRMNNIQLLSGKQHLDGITALGLVRERWALPEGDFGRQSEQSQILKSMIKELLAPEHIVKTVALLPKLKKNMVDTNFEDSDTLSLVRMFKGMKEDDFQYAQIPGHAGYDNDPLVQMKLYYWIPDMVKVRAITEKMLKNN